MFPRLSLADAGWYHSFEFPDGRLIEGIVPLTTLRWRWDMLGLPDDLSGKRALDIGAWDGWFAFELERRGAEVVVIDSTETEGFEIAKRALGSRVERRLQTVYELDPNEIGRFDIVLFQGVLYHLKHPLLALEKVCSVANDLVFVESYVTGGPDEPPNMAFYEKSELRDQFDNWCGPNVACLLAFCRVAGLVDVRLQGLDGDRARVVCRARWPDRAGPPVWSAPHLLAVASATTRRASLHERSDEYAALFFRCEEPELTEDDVYVTLGGYGASTAQVRSTGPDGWEAVCRIPPGLSPGRIEAWVRTRGTSLSNVLTIELIGSKRAASARPAAAAPAPAPGSIAIQVVADGKTWERNVLSCPERCLSLWVLGLGDDVRESDLRVAVGKHSAEVLFLSGRAPDGTKQINVRVPPDLPSETTSVRVRCGDATSPPAPLAIRPPGGPE